MLVSYFNVMPFDEFGNYVAGITGDTYDAPPVQGGAATDYYPIPGPPTGTPAANNLLNIIVDSNGRQWQFFNNQWN